VYCGRFEAGTGCDVSGADGGADVAVGVREGGGVAEAVNVGRGVRLGRNVRVGNGVKLSTTGWKGVAVALAFGLAVTRLRGGGEAGGSPEGSEQDARSINPHSTLNARNVRRVILIGVREVYGNQV
jgi:hypothetical protein